MMENRRLAREFVDLYRYFITDMFRFLAETQPLRAIAGRLNQAGYATRPDALKPGSGKADPRPSPWLTAEFVIGPDRGHVKV
jgi:hypothetical protein